MIKPKLITDNPELLLYLDGKLHIPVLGGIKLTGFDRLKVTLKLVQRTLIVALVHLSITEGFVQLL